MTTYSAENWLLPLSSRCKGNNYLGWLSPSALTLILLVPVSGTSDQLPLPPPRPSTFGLGLGWRKCKSKSRSYRKENKGVREEGKETLEGSLSAHEAKGTN